MPTNVSNAVSTILSNPNVISGLKTISVNINSRSYSVETPPERQTAQSNNNNNELNLAGIIIGVIAGVIVIGLASYMIYRKIKAKNRLESMNNDGEEFKRIDESMDQASASDNDMILSNIPNIPSSSTPPSNPSSSKPITVSQYFKPSKSKSVKPKTNSSSSNIVEDIE